MYIIQESDNRNRPSSITDVMDKIDSHLGISGKRTYEYSSGNTVILYTEKDKYYPISKITLESTAHPSHEMKNGFLTSHIIVEGNTELLSEDIVSSAAYYNSNKNKYGEPRDNYPALLDYDTILKPIDIVKTSVEETFRKKKSITLNRNKKKFYDIVQLLVKATGCSPEKADSTIFSYLDSSQGIDWRSKYHTVNLLTSDMEKMKDIISGQGSF